MSKQVEELRRLSVIDGSVEAAEKRSLSNLKTELEPVYANIVVTILGLDGPEETTQQRLVGYKKKES